MGGSIASLRGRHRGVLARTDRGRTVEFGTDCPCSASARCAGDGGGPLVEFAILLPFLSILVFGTVDLGRAFSLKTRVTNMAREGASYAQYYPGRVDGCTTDSITSLAKLETSSVSNATVSVRQVTGSTSTPLTGCTSSIPPGSRIRVTVSAPMTIITPLVSAVVGNPVTVSGYQEVVVQG